MRTLLIHQQEALDYAMYINNPALLMEMRLGKTLTIIRYAQAKCKGPIIVCAPVTVLGSWEYELEMEGEEFVYAQGHSQETKLSMLKTVLNWPGRTWYLTTYESLGTLPEQAVKKWQLAVFDESVKMKNHKSTISLMCTEGFRDADQRSILTGNIAPENPLEVFQQFKCLDGQFMGYTDYYKFRYKMAHKSPSGFGWEVMHDARERIKNVVHARAFVLRRKDAGLEKQKFYQTVKCMSNDLQRELIKQVVDFGYKDPYTGEIHETMYQPVVEGWLTRIAGGFDPSGKHCISENKFNATIGTLSHQTEDFNKQAVVWFKYRAELMKLEKMLMAEKVRVGVIHGGVTGDARNRKVREFREGKFDVMLATEKSAKYGIDCSTACCAVYYSNELSCDDRTQSEERILNMMKEHPLYYFDMCTKGTVDEKAIPKIQDKTFDARDFMTDYREYVHSL